MIFEAGRSVARLRAQCLGGRRAWVQSTTERESSLHKILAASNEFTSLVKPSLITPIIRRFYADQPVSRPKAHTGRATIAKKAAGTTSVKGTKGRVSATSKTSTTKSRAKPKKKSKPKAKKRVRAKKGKKAKAKPKRRVLTEKQKAARTVKLQREKVRELKKKALLDSPSSAPISAYTAYVIEQMKFRNKDTQAKTYLAELGAKWKNVTPEQLEHFNAVAIQKTAAKKAESTKWVESHTPEEIREANVARRSLTSQRRIRRPKSPPITLIKDDRLVRLPRSAYILFYKGRHESGLYKGMKVIESARLASREWKALTGAEKKPYEDASAQDKQRYNTEKKTVYKQ